MTSDLQIFHERVQMSKSGAFTELKALIDNWVQESHEAMLGCMSNMETRGLLSLRYQQRLCLKREIENWVASAEEAVAQITEDMRRDLENEQQPDYATSASA